MNGVGEILLVSGQSTHAELMRSRLVSQNVADGFYVAPSIRSAIDWLTENNPVLVLSDLILSDGRALDILDRLEGKRGWPIVVVSEMGEISAAVASIKAGASDYVIKTSQFYEELPGLCRRVLMEWQGAQDFHCPEKSTELYLRRMQEQNAQLEEEIAERQKAETAFRSNEARLLAVLSAVPDQIGLMARDGIVLPMGVEGCSYHQTGLDPSIFPYTWQSLYIGKKVHEFLPANVADVFVSETNRTLETRQMQTVHYRIAIPGGIRDREARFVYCAENEVLFIVRDITESKREAACETLLRELSAQIFAEEPADEILKALCGKLVEIFNLNGAVIAWKKPDGATSSIAHVLFDIPEKMVQAARWDDPHTTEMNCQAIRTGQEIFFRASQEGLAPENLKAAKGIGIESAAAFPVQYAGETIGSLSVMWPHEEDLSESILRLLRNFSKEVAAVVKAAKSREQISLLINGLNAAVCGVAIFDTGRNIIWANAAFTDMTGYEAQELNNGDASIMRKREGEHSASAANDWQRIVAGESFQTTGTRTRKDGTTYVEEQKYTPVRNESGVVTHVVCIMTDISERINTTQALLKAQTTAAKAEKLYSLATLASGISHEINQPLNAIKVLSSSIEYARELGAQLDPEETIRLVSEISRQADRIRDIINHLRSFMERDEADLIPVNLNTAVQQSLTMIGRQLAANEVKITLELAEELPDIKAVLTGLVEIIVNLVINSMQALKESYKKEKRVVIRTMFDEGKAILEVADNGTGISRELGDKIFEPFFSTKAQGDGFGLGLAIVQSLVNVYGGSITYHSQPGEGTTFVVKFASAHSGIVE